MNGRAEFNTHRFTIGLLPNFLGISSSLSNGCPPCCTLREEGDDQKKMIDERLCDSYAEFSFGVVLQELIAGPKTVGKFGDGVDIVRRVKKTISERAQWVPTSKHHKPVQDCHHVHRPKAYDEGSRAHDHQSSFARCGIASCHALAF